MSNTQSLLLLADQYAAAHAKWALEDLYGASNSYTAEKLRERHAARSVLEKAIVNAPQPVVREPRTCEWTHNDDDGYWDTSCGKAWRFDDGGPKENNMNFCHCCGKTLRIKGGQHGTE